MAPVYKNYPVVEILKAWERLIPQGWVLFQKFSCEKCMQRLEIDEPNKFYTVATCDKCGHFTDIAKTGCNYTAIKSLNGPAEIIQLVVSTRSEEETAALRKQVYGVN